MRDSPLLLWAGLLIGPLACLAVLGANFAMVPWACAFSMKWPLFLINGTGLAAAAGSGILSWGIWGQAGREWPSESGGAVPRSRFMAAGGLLLSAFSVLVLLAQCVPQIVMGACQ